MKKRGFTLIELLAVIVVLAIIVLIAVPIILNMIESATKGAAIDSTYGYVEAIETYMVGQEFDDVEAELVYGENLVKDINNVIKINGKAPTSGKIVIDKNNKVVDGINICFYNYSVQYQENKVFIKGKCGEEDKVIDKKPCQLEEEKITINEETKEYLYIDSVEDMYAFSKSVNSGNTYEGKIVKIRNDLDFSKYKTENKVNVCETGDNEQGFVPIGTSSKPFMGTLDGNTKTISNLTINRPNQDNIGIFGYIKNAKIYGLNLENINIIGNKYVGGLIGYSYGSSSSNKVTIREIVMKNVNVKGNQYIGGLVGYESNFAPIINNILYKSGSVEGNAYASSILNASISDITNSMVIDVDVKGTSSYILYHSSANNSYKTFYSEKSTLNGVIGTDGFSSSYIDDIDYYTWKLETRIEGDSNKTGYYFDYIYSKGEVGLISVNDTTNKPPFDATEENTSNGTCTAVYGDWISTCAPYTSGIHGGYAYKKADNPVGAACTGMNSTIEYYPVYRAKVTYICN